MDKIAGSSVAGTVGPAPVAYGAFGEAPTMVTPASPLPVTEGALPAGADRSGTITAGGVAQGLAPANPARKALTGQNISTGDLWINEIGGNAAIGQPGSYKVAAGESFAVSTNRAISIVGATTGQAFTATEV